MTTTTETAHRPHRAAECPNRATCPSAHVVSALDHADAPPAYDPRTDYPRWDEAHATTIVSTDEVYVETDVQPTDDGAYLEIRRTVWKIAYRAKDRHILWTGTVALIPRAEVPAFARDIVSSLI